MNHIAVDSSQIASIAHDPAKGRMQVLFKRGGLYEYSNVTAQEFAAVASPNGIHKGSVGTAFFATIKGRKAFTKLGESLDEVTPQAEAEPAPRITEVAIPPADAAPASEAPLPPEVALVQSKSTSLATQAQEIKVVDPDTQVLAADMLITVAQMQTEIEKTFEPMKAAAFKAHRVICQQETNLKAPLVMAEKALKGEIAGYIDAQNRLAREADEANRKAALEQAEREATAATIDQAIDQAIDLEARGNTQAAEAVLANPAPAPIRYQAPAPTRPNVAVTKGVPSRQDWDFQIIDFNQIPREYLLINESAIRSAGKTTQGRIKIAGVEFFPKTIVATSRRG
jgi:hypothetical protein